MKGGGARTRAREAPREGKERKGVRGGEKKSSERKKGGRKKIIMVS